MTTLPRLRFRILALFVGLSVSQLVCPPDTLAQAETASVSGRVTDQSGGVVPDVEVEIKNTDTGISLFTKTSGEGFYLFPSLKPGNYLMNVRKQAFRTVSVTGMILNVQDNVSRNFVLEVGSSAQSITVTADGVNLNTTDGSVGTVVDRQFVENIPLNGRSFQQLITLTPGVVLTKASVGQEGQFSVNGQRANANNFTVDGVSADFGIQASGPPGISAGGTLPALTTFGGTNSLVSVDAMQEFRVQTSTYAPEFGRQPGGQISIVTRSGTNEFHGGLFEYFRNDVLDANDWFANRNGLPKPPLRQNDFGGTVGGPIYKNRTFFFFSYEGLRLRQPQVTTVIVPSAASRQAAVPGMKPFFDAYPVPNGPDLGNGFAQFSGSYADQQSLDATSIRIDHSAKKITVFGRYNYAPSFGTSRTVRVANLSGLNRSSQNIQTLTLGSTQILWGNVSNDVRVNLSRAKAKDFSESTDFAGAIPPTDSQVFPSFTGSSEANVLVQITGGSPFFVGTGGGNRQRQINVVDGLSVVAGRHQLKFGFDYRRLSPTRGVNEYDQTVTFTSVANAQQGAASSVGIRAFVDGVESVFTNVSTYAQDTWRITPRFTLTFGLRWEVNPAPKGKEGRELFRVQWVEPLTQATQFAPAGSSLYDTTYDNLAPRIGAAYQLSQKPGKELVLRGGFGVFYDLGASRVAGQTVGNFPYTARRTISNVTYPLGDAAAAPPPFPDPTVPPTGAAGSAFEPGLSLPRAYQWNFTVEHALSRYHAVSAAYVGAVGRELLRAEFLLLPNSSFSSILAVRNAGTSDYHAFQLQFRGHSWRGLQVLASYNWSHSIDIASQDTRFTDAPGDFTDPAIDRGSSDFDVRHSFSSAVSYDFPTSTAKKMSVILGHWSADAIVTVRSATPVDLVGRSIFVPFFANLRPDVVPGVPLLLNDNAAPGGKRFNPAAFAAPPSNRQGTLGRNVVRGFGMWQVDFGVRRSFRLSEQLALHFRTEFFNLFNHPNFADPVNNIANPLFGVSTQMFGRGLGTGSGVQGGFNPLFQVGGPRSIQFSLKVQF